MKIANHTALKEWSTVIEALASGRQVILIRKGGIADPTFGVEADRFYLYPTYYHQPAEAEEPTTVTISHWCEVVRTWRVRDLELLHRLEPLVAMSREALETRYRFRPDQALHVIGVRTFALPEPVTIEVKPEYIGCRSWLSIDDEIQMNGSHMVMTSAELQARLESVDVMLAAAV
jgi:hypothetical protein